MTQGYALSPQQLEFWSGFDERNKCAQLILKVEGELNFDLLQHALVTVVERHEMLRTFIRCQATDSQPMQFIGDVNITWSTTDLRRCKPSVMDVALEACLKADRERFTNSTSENEMFASLICCDAEVNKLLISVAAYQLDSVSMDILVEDLATAYRSLDSGQCPIFNEDPVQYVDYSEWSNEINAESESHSGKAYWQALYHSVQAQEALPIEKPVNTNKSFDLKSTGLQFIDKTIVAELEVTAKALDADVYGLLFAVWQILLYRINKVPESLIGVLNSGRDDDSDTIVGLVGKYYPHKIALNDNLTIADLLQSNMTRAVEAGYRMRYLNRTSIDVDFGNSQCHYCFASESQKNIIDAGKVKFDVLERHVFDSVFKLKLVCRYERADSNLALNFHFDNERIDKLALDRLVAQYHCLLRSVIDTPNQSLGCLNILPVEQRKQVLDDFNSNQRDYSFAKNIVDQFEKQASKFSERLAVECQESHLTYRELNIRANQLGYELRKNGVGSGVVVGVFLPRSIDVIVSILAIMKAGGIYLPLDITYPKERIGYMLEDACVKIVITNSDLTDNLKGATPSLFTLDSVDLKDNDLSNLELPLQADQTAYIIYTSGTTGLPKGTTVPHGSLIQHCFGVQETYDLTEVDRVLLFAPFSFDPSLEQSLPALMSGATVVLKEDALWDASEIGDKIRALQLTVVNFPTSYWHLIVQFWANNLPIQDLLSLRLMIAGGDRMLPEAVECWASLGLTGVRLLNAYGPTEATITATVAEIHAPEESKCFDIPIGRSLPNRRAYVLDEFRQPVPIGIVAELYLGGECLASGYFNRPKATNDYFVDDPFANQSGKMMYKTGDRAFFSATGDLYFVGRVDDQVKVRGYRIELGEVEKNIAALKGVREVAVVAREAASGGADKQLIAFYVSSQQGTEVQDLSAQMRTRLPDYMLPSVYVCIAEMPLSPNGKIDRKTLMNYAVGGGREGRLRSPKTDIESMLVASLRELIGREGISIDDGFIQAGGHSLIAMRLSARVKQEYSIELSLTDIYGSENIEALAKVIECAMSQSTQVAPMPPISHSESDVERPLSYSQQRLWLLDEMGFGSQYHMPGALMITGTLDEKALTSALAFVVGRHDSLRTNVVRRDDMLFQAVTRDMSIVVERRNISDIRMAKWRDELQQWAQLPFNLSTDPLLRVLLLQADTNTWVLAICMHHLIADGMSVSIFLNEMSEAYRCFKQGETIILPQLNIQYADFSCWQQTHLNRKSLEPQLSFWREKLSAYQNFDSLTDLPRPNQLSGSAGLVRHVIPIEQVDGFKAFCQSNQLTLNSILVSAIYFVLSRNSGQSDFCIGMPVSGRVSEDVQNIIGCFVNTLVIRPDSLFHSKTCGEFLRRVQNTVVEAQAHQDVPFEMLVEELATQRDLGRNPIFQIMINYIQSGRGLTLDDAELNIVDLEYAAAKCDLAFDFTESFDGELELSITYSDQLYKKDSIEQLIDQVCSVLGQLVCKVDCALEKVELLDAKQQQQLVSWSSCMAREDSMDATSTGVHGLFEKQVKLSPNSVALEVDGHSYSYLELNQTANRLAHYLIAQGAATDTLVGLCVDRSLDTVIGLLAILKAGAGYVPLDPSYPHERLIHMVNDSNVALVVTHNTYKEKPFLAGIPLICVDDPQAQSLLDSYPCTDPDREHLGLRSDNIAYVIYTSGSTGLPKGVIIEHRALSNFLEGAIQRLALDADTRWLALTTLAFDISGLEIFAPLICGGRVYLADRAQVVDGLKLASLLDVHDINVMQATPAGWRLLLDCGWQGRSKLVALCGGEALPKGLAQQLIPRCHQLINCYGPTEATIWSHMAPVNNVESGIAIDGLLPGYRHYVVLPSAGSSENNTLDHTMFAPIGVAGELLLGGSSLARGYLNRPELSREKFIKNGIHPDELVYRTGDLVRWLPNGAMEYLGRKDQQVKIRGFRIELEEIENQLGKIPGIGQAAVTAQVDRNGDNHLVAYIVLNKEVRGFDAGNVSLEQQDSKLEYKRAISLFLPQYMVPQHYVVVDKLPLTPNGKIDRKMLPLFDLTATIGTEYRAPVSAIEKQLSILWQEVLALPRVSMDDNFFAIGGHSLLASKLISRVRESFQREISLRTLFDAPTIAQFAKALDRSDEAALLPAVVRLEQNRELRLSYAQQRLWFLDQIGKGSAEYNMPAAFYLEGDLDITALKNSFAAVLQRHEVLRTVFDDSDAGALQVVSNSYKLPFFNVDFSVMDPSLRTSRMRQFIQDKSVEIFDLRRDVLMRMYVIKMSTLEHVVMINMHHIASDGWSVGLLLSEFNELYRAYSSGEENRLEPLKVQYSDYAHWQHQWLTGAMLNQQIDYWQRQLKGIPVVHNLPLDKARPAQQQYAGKTHLIHLDSSIKNQINQLCDQQSVTLFMFLQTAFAVFLSRYSNETDIVMGTTVAGRVHKDIESLVGFFVNTLILRSDLTGEQTFTESLKRNKQMILDAYTHQYIPFENLVEALNPDRTLRHGPLFQVLLVLQNNTSGDLDFPGIKTQAIPLENTRTKFDLELSVEQTDVGLSLSWHYNTALFFDDTIVRMANNFSSLLGGIVATPDCLVGKLPLLAESEKTQLLLRHRSSAKKYDEELCVHQQFELHAENEPNKIAVVVGGEAFTYRQINQRSNQLAHHLISQGVGAEDLIGLCLERSVEMIIGILAIVKSGAAYIPLDPSYPIERLHYVVDDSNARLVLTTEALLSLMPEARLDSVICLDSERTGNHLKSLPSCNPLNHVSPNAPMYVIYTSGSTGNPKGVLVEHHNVTRLFKAADKQFEFSDQDVWTLFHSFAFDFSVWEIWGALSYGGTLVVVEKEIARDAIQFRDLLAREKVTVLSQIPSAFYALVRAMQTPGPDHYLKTVVFGGEALDYSQLKPWYAIFGDQRTQLVNMYGITETTVHVTYKLIEAEDVDSWTSCIGYPLDDLSTVICDEYQQLVPYGVAGELLVGGGGVTRGYLNRPELTQERFIPDPFTQSPGNRLYRTGDLVRQLANGSLEYIGRIDHQVKIRGFRMELGEIEYHLATLSGVEDGVVMAKTLSNREKHLVAYVVQAENLRAEERVDQQRNNRINQIVNGLKEILPDYMVPKIYVFLAAMPLTPSGKIDRKSLPNPEEQDLQKNIYAAPENPVEAKLCEIWEGHLQLQKVGIDDNYFALGGDSIRALNIVALAKKQGIRFSVTDVFQYPTVRQLSQNASLLTDPDVADDKVEVDEDELALLLEQIENMNEIDVETLMENA